MSAPGLPRPLGHWIQVDVTLAQQPARFWMDSCAGRDQVAMSAYLHGWQAYEAPLPLLLARWCAALQPVLVDVGANSGFYTLLALATGASQVHAFEPVAEIADVLRANAQMSELEARLQVHQLALGAAADTLALHFPDASHGLLETSASLNPAFRAQHAGVRQVPVRRLGDVLAAQPLQGKAVLVKLDVETHESAVLRGAAAWIDALKPALVCEILPQVDTGFFERFAAEHDYQHYDMGAAGLVGSDSIVVSPTQRDHLFLYRPDAHRWLAPLDMA
jgi:FkbM family methyltransferase